ncbi:MAG: HEAT repeat domain-containing protein [Acidobacteria bacterium]|nr:HEAT repeat domain-containing protein [Acidobacteriota bacterium]
MHSKRFLTISAVTLAVAALSIIHTPEGEAQNRVSIAVPPDGEAQLQSMLQPGQAYGVLLSAPDPGLFPPKGRIFAHVRGLAEHETRKPIHAGDPDWYFTVVPQEPTQLFILLSADRMDKEVSLDYEITVLPAGDKTAAIGGLGHADWRDAQPVRLDTPVYASGDHRPYIPTVGYPEETYQQMLDGVDWYKFDYKGEGDRLLHLNLEVIDRDVPVDVALFTIEDGKPVEYTRGRERFDPEKSTVLHGLYKFAPRVIAPGTYYVRVMADHPAYKLELNTYDPPPYADPQLAVRVAMDYIVRKGDSWHANVPRRGMSALRTANVVQETKLCIACHPTHFSTRSEMIAVENGYPVQAQESLRFLVERLMQNPRPIYGHTDASWARMIHAPGNVLTRLAYIANKYEQNLVHERRDELYRGVAEFMELYWPGVQEPQPESNGNLPRISGFEVAHHSAVLFRDLQERTGQAKYRALADQAVNVAATGEPVDMLDLAWQTVALADLDKAKYQAKIDANVQKMFELQKSDGSWAMPFGMEIMEYDWRNHTVSRTKIPQRAGQEGPRSAEFQTYHTLYALARAGVPADDPHVKKAIAYALSHQTASGAWQGEPEYKNFDTPFRDTQYAIMALSEYFPGPAGKGGVHGLGKPKASLAGAGATAKLAILDATWEKPDELTAEMVRRELDSPHVLVRRQAALALGRYADTDAIGGLAKSLGDESKLVQRAAAWSLRQIAMRSGEGRADAIAAIRKALASDNPRVRWGATRVFNQHFKYISEEWPLAEDLIRLSTTEPVPAVKMQAIQGLYQWYFWDRSTEHKGRIEEALIAGLGREEHPWVRRNFIEAYYNTLDDNLRYLYGSWMERIKREDDRAEVREGHQAHVKEQAARFDRAMREGNALTRDGLLRALHTHVLREGQGDVKLLAESPAPETVEGPFLNGYKWFSIHDPLTGGTGTRAGTGNDSDPPRFYEESAPLMNDALLSALDPQSPELIRETLKALEFLKPFPANEAFGERMLALVGETRGELRAEIALAAREHLPEADIAGPKTAARLAELASEGDAAALETVAAIVRSPKQKKLAADAGVRAAISARLRASKAGDAEFPYVVQALSALPAERRNPELAAKALSGLESSDSAARKASVTLLFEDSELFEQPEAASAWRGFLDMGGAAAIEDALTLAGSLNYDKKAHADVLPRIEALVITGMAHSKPAVREAALSALRTIQPLQDESAVKARLYALRKDSDANVRNSAASLDASLAARAGREGYDLQQLLDYEFFKYNVEPILARKASDGLACVNCHANHTVFKLREPDEFGAITHADSMANYKSAIGVVNISDPLNSLLLNKPTRRLDDVGVGDSQKLTHGGGLRWPTGTDSPEYRTILRWIQGERLGSAAEHSEE